MTGCVNRGEVNADKVTPHDEAFQGVVWHLPAVVVPPCAQGLRRTTPGIEWPSPCPCKCVHERVSRPGGGCPSVPCCRALDVREGIVNVRRTILASLTHSPATGSSARTPAGGVSW